MFVEIKCPSCGASCEIAEDRAVAFCTFCGTKMINEQAPIQIDNSATVKNLLLRAQQFAESGDKVRAREYFDRVLDIDALCQHAVFGIRKLDGLPCEENLFFVLDKSANFHLSVELDGAAIGSIERGKALFVTATPGDHSLVGIAFGSERSRKHTLTVQPVGRTIMIADYGIRGITFRVGSESDLPKVYGF